MAAPPIMLNCVNCNKRFSVQAQQYKYQEKKKPGRDWFCSRSCTSTHNNLHKRSEKYKADRNDRMRCLQPEASARGSGMARKYGAKFSWYVRRTASDGRFGQKPMEWKLQFEKIIEEEWMKCQGRCAFTGVQLHLRDIYGKAETENAFLIASVDRIDSSKPYQKGNIQWVSIALNKAKGNSDDLMFREWLKSIQITCPALH